MKVTPSLVMYCAAAQIVLTTVGFILYKRPYLWAWEALEYYSEVYCGRELDKVNAKYGSYDIKYKQQIQYKVVSYRADCQERYLETFTEQFYTVCMANTKSAFVSIPIVSSILIVGIVLCLHWAPFHKRTLKKPGFMLAFLLSLVLVAVNIGQIITILVPLINSHASPDHNYRRNDANRRMKCGYGSEVTALALVLTTSILSALIAYFIIKLYIIRIKGQDENLKKGNLRMETLEEYEQQKAIKKQLKKDKKHKRSSKHYASTLSSVHEDEDVSDDDQFAPGGMPMAGGHLPMPQASPNKPKSLSRQDSGWGHSTPQRGKY